jgi:hypothetical protein
MKKEEVARRRMVNNERNEWLAGETFGVETKLKTMSRGTEDKVATETKKSGRVY